MTASSFARFVALSLVIAVFATEIAQCFTLSRVVAVGDFPSLLPTAKTGTHLLLESIARIVAENDEVTETRYASGMEAFTGIELSGGGVTVELTCQQEPSLQVIGDPDVVRSVETVIEGGQLSIRATSWKLGKKSVLVRVGTQTLENVEMAGANTLKIVRLLTNQLDAEMSGTCVLEVSGKAKKFSVEASGACIVNAKDLIAERIVVEAGGASKVIVNAEKQLCASVSGVSKIVYYGDPKTLNKDVCGMGRIVQQTK